VAEVKDGHRITWLQGHSVINDQNEMIGTISEFVVGRDLAIFAILQVGGFIGFRTTSRGDSVQDAGHRRGSVAGRDAQGAREFPRIPVFWLTRASRYSEIN
jgi:hypothetical protein